jgi:hypothetical protein
LLYGIGQFKIAFSVNQDSMYNTDKSQNSQRYREH